MFSSYGHLEGTVYAIKIKKYFFIWLHICYAHSLGQDLGGFWKPALQLIKYAHIYQITDFHITVIPEAIFKLEQSNLVQLEHLTHYLTWELGFVIIKKLLDEPSLPW